MKWLKRILLALVVVFGLIQAWPYGRAHTNPPGRVEPPWSSPAVRALAVRACFDCHSNESRWPWYSHVAPMSWLVQKDVDEARENLNFSEWDKPQRKAKDAADEVEEGEMPPALYLPLHAEAKLTAAEKAELVAGLKALAPKGDDDSRKGDGGRKGKGKDDDGR